MDEKEKLEEIKQIVREKRVVFAPQDKINELRPWVKEVLQALGYPTAWVSDQSMVGDFDVDENKLGEVAEKLGVPLNNKDYIVDVAFRLRDMGETQ